MILYGAVNYSVSMEEKPSYEIDRVPDGGKDTGWDCGCGAGGSSSGGCSILGSTSSSGSSRITGKPNTSQGVTGQGTGSRGVITTSNGNGIDGREVYEQKIAVGESSWGNDRNVTQANRGSRPAIESGIRLEGGGWNTENLSKDDLGELIGKGGNKEVYFFGNDKVIALMQDGKPLEAIDKEINMLQQLDDLGLPTVNAENVIVDGQPGILMDRCAQDSKSIAAYDKTKCKVILLPNAETGLLNQNSINDLTKIKQIMNFDKIKIDDFQFLIKQDGHIVIADPLKVTVGQLPSKNNNRMIDILIEEAKKNR